MDKQMRVFITGASGLLGGRIFEYLKRKKIEVIIASRSKKIFKGNKFKKINWNSNKNLEKLCKKVDVVINCAGYDVHKSKIKSKTFLVNSKRPYQLYKAAQNAGVSFFIFLSTAHVYNNNLVGNVNEKTKTTTNKIYGLSKLDGEKKLIRYKKKHTKLLILRPSNLFGYPINKKVKCWKLLINSLIRDLVVYNKTTILSKRNSYRNYASIEGFCSFIYLIIQNYFIKKKKLPTIINYCSEYNLNLTEVIRILKERFDRLKINKNLKIKYKNKFLKKEKKLFYKSIHSRKLKFRTDKFFNKEVSNLILYCKSNFINY